MKKIYAALVLSVLFVFSAAAQSSEKISEILKNEEITFGQAAYVIATYKSLVAEDAGYEDAFLKLQEQKIISEKYTSDSLIMLRDVSYLCSWATELKGGLFYRIFKNSRYAFKELQAKGVLPKDVDPDYRLSGRDFFDVFNSCVELEGGE